MPCGFKDNNTFDDSINYMGEPKIKGVDNENRNKADNRWLGANFLCSSFTCVCGATFGDTIT